MPEDLRAMAYIDLYIVSVADTDLISYNKHYSSQPTINKLEIHMHHLKGKLCNTGMPCNPFSNSDEILCR